MNGVHPKGEDSLVIIDQTVGGLMNDEEYVAERRRALKESVDFFASKNKIEREKMVVAETLTNLGVNYSEDELSPVSDEPPDIRFQDAEFEIKEIMDPDRRRHLEYKVLTPAENCSGHMAGYRWAKARRISTRGRCIVNSESFAEGCLSYVAGTMGEGHDTR